MNDKFADSNILLYLFSNDSAKKETALQIFNAHPIISFQVIGENMNVCLRDLKFTVEKSLTHAQELQKNCDVRHINATTIACALQIFKRYKYSFWDSLIIASALEAKCTTLYTEDLQHKQVIENIGENEDAKLTIVNPFL